MLVLSRKPSETILIGDDIVVTVVRIGPNTVRIGIEAPRDVNVVRGELVEPIEATPSDRRVAAPARLHDADRPLIVL